MSLDDAKLGNGLTEMEVSTPFPAASQGHAVNAAVPDVDEEERVVLLAI